MAYLRRAMLAPRAEHHVVRVRRRLHGRGRRAVASRRPRLPIPRRGAPGRRHADVVRELEAAGRACRDRAGMAHDQQRPARRRRPRAARGSPHRPASASGPGTAPHQFLALTRWRRCRNVGHDPLDGHARVPCAGARHARAPRLTRRARSPASPPGRARCIRSLTAPDVEGATRHALRQLCDQHAVGPSAPQPVVRGSRTARPTRCRPSAHRTALLPDLSQRTRVHVVDEAAHALAFGDEGACLDALDAVADALVDVLEGAYRPVARLRRSPRRAWPRTRRRRGPRGRSACGRSVSPRWCRACAGRSPGSG